jgi:hypothetical protein
MTLTVRLDTAVEAALDRYCAESGVTKSAVVQQSLAAFLVDRQTAERRPRRGAAPGAPARHSANYLAFARAGLIGAGELGGVAATNAVVRERARARIKRTAA